VDILSRLKNPSEITYLKPSSAEMTAVDAGVFNPPSKYKTVKDMQSIILSKSARGARTEEVQELFHDF